MAMSDALLWRFGRGAGARSARQESATMMRQLILAGILTCANASTVHELLAHEPPNWRDEHLSRGAVVQLTASAEPQVQLEIEQLATDVWRSHTHPDGSAMDVQVRHDFLGALSGIRSVNITSVVHDDLLALIEAQAARRTRSWNASAAARAGRRPPEDDPFFDEYRSGDELERWMQLLAAQHPETVSYIPTIGPSIEGRNIPALAFGGEVGGPAVYMQAGLHAREWISHATLLYIASALVNSEEPRIQRLVRDVRFYLVPNTNPDGYEWTWTGPINRMLRKNRRPDLGGICDGVDLNRNYDDHWGMGPLCSAALQCLPTYRGEGPASEPEVRATQDYMAEIATRHTVLGALDWHSYSQLILRPYGWVAPAVEAPPNDAEHTQIGQEMADAIEASMGEEYTSQPSTSLYATCGSAGDYLYSEFGPQSIAFTMELRPAGLLGGGFVLPDAEIRPSGEENVAGVVSFVEALLEQHRRRMPV